MGRMATLMKTSLAATVASFVLVAFVPAVAAAAAPSPPFATFDGSESFTSIDTSHGDDPTIYTWTYVAHWHLVYEEEGAAPAIGPGGSSISMTDLAVVKGGGAAATTLCQASVTENTSNNLNQTLGVISELGVAKGRATVAIQVNRPTTYLDSTGQGGSCRTRLAPLPDPLPGTLSVKGTLAVTGTTYTGIVAVGGHSAGTTKGTQADYTWNVALTGSIEFGLPVSTYVALGDSYSSGQLQPLLPGGAACSRSSLSYAIDYDPLADVLACSGATIGNIRADQVPLIPSTTRLVTVTAGGNDTGIYYKLINCVTGSATFIDCKSQYQLANFSTLQPQLVGLYQAIHDRAPKAQLYVMGYPDAFPATPQKDCPGLGAGSYLKVYGTDAPYFYGLVQELNRVVKRAAAASGVAHYVEPFSGHDVCSSDSYFMPLDTPTVIEKLHPNSAGHAAWAQLLRDAAGAPPS
jgi:lysophospholipase L1-like esterase